jgi:YD repeat-containing protein
VLRELDLKNVLRCALAACVLLLGAAAHAAPTDCFGQSPDGKAICQPPEITPLAYGACLANSLSTVENAIGHCNQQWGLLSGPVYSEAPVVGAMNCVYQRVTGSTASPVTSFAWKAEGQGVSSSLCWNDAVKWKYGVEMRGYAEQSPPGWYKLVGRRDRTSYCRPGEYAVNGSDGYIDYCTSTPTNSRACTAGNPTDPALGVKIERSIDYAGAGAHPLAFERIYRSMWRPLLPASRVGGFWGHNYSASARILEVATFGTRYAHVTRADGEHHIYTNVGTGWTAATGSRNTLTELRDANAALAGLELRVWSDDSTETYDRSGRLLKITNRNGWVTMLTYSDAETPVATAPRPGLLISVKNHFGRELRFTYDAQGRMAELLPPGAVSGTGAGSATSPVRYQYDEAASLGSGVAAQGQLTSVTWQDGSTRRYHHEQADTSYIADGPQLLSGITDEAGVRYASWAYIGIQPYSFMPKGARVVTAQGANGANRLEFSYYTLTSGQLLTYITDYASGNAQRFSQTFEQVGVTLLPVAATANCPQCGSTAQSTVYNVSSDKIREVAHDGSVTFFAYDAKGRETERASFPSSFNIATTRPALASATKVISTKWHATFNLPTQVAEPNKTTANTYNSKGMLTGQSWTATTDATGAAKFSAVKTGSTYATGWSYSASSLATTVIEKETPAGATVATETGRWTVTYKTDGSINKITDAVSTQSATLTADASGLTTKITASNGAVATFTGNTRGQMIKAVTPRVTTDFSIDALGLTNEIRFSDGRWIRYSYNASRRIIKITDSNGQVEQYAGLEPSWFLDEKTIRTAAAWLSLRGKRFADMLIPEAKAQSAIVVVPAVIVLGLIFIFEGQRRNGASAPGGASCCGQDGTPGVGGGDETLASRWSRQITTLLSDQTMPAQSAPAPIYDKAGLLVSPKACIPPPGNCDPNKHRDMQDEVNNACKGQARRCGGGLSRVELIERLELNRSCAIARDKINKTCFAGGDKDHRDQAHDAWSSVTRCEDFLSRVP